MPSDTCLGEISAARDPASDLGPVSCRGVDPGALCNVCTRPEGPPRLQRHSFLLFLFMLFDEWKSCQVLTQIRFISSHIECLKNTFIRNSFGLYAERQGLAQRLCFPLGQARAPLFLSLMGKTLLPFVSNTVPAGRGQSTSWRGNAPRNGA